MKQLHFQHNYERVYKTGRYQLDHKTTYYVTKYEGWNFNSGNYLFTTDTK